MNDQAAMDAECRAWLDDLRGDGICGALSRWESGFLASVRGRLSWTNKQHEHIGRIWREKSRAGREAARLEAGGSP